MNAVVNGYKELLQMKSDYYEESKKSLEVIKEESNSFTSLKSTTPFLILSFPDLEDAPILSKNQRLQHLENQAKKQVGEKSYQ